jgi:hypothetical protein
MDTPFTNQRDAEGEGSSEPVMDIASYISEYQKLGWKLCPIPSGKKGPVTPDWGNNPLPDSGGTVPQGVGLIHGHSGTVAIDIDDVKNAEAWLQLNDIDLRSLLEGDDSVLIESGRSNHKKLLYRLPSGSGPLTRATVRGPNETDMIDFRCVPKSGVPPI